jgi:uncharacterized protein (TIGR00106 family)
MLAEFTIIPIGVGESLSRYVADLVKIVEKSGLDYRLTPMSTVVEGEWDEVMSLIALCHKRTRESANRVITSITIDDRAGKKDRLIGKIESVEKVLGKGVKK